MYNFAWQHLKAATIFRDKVVELEQEHEGEPFGSFYEEIRSYCSACIMSSAAGLEALINELFIVPRLRFRPMLPEFEKQFWSAGGIERKPILWKYRRAIAMLQASPLDELQSPFRDVWALIELRNALVHYKPTRDPARKQKVELVQVLDGRYATSPFLEATADFVSMKSMSAGCATWAVANTLNFIRQFDERTSLDPSKMAGFLKLK